jgi:hypothetical protein
MTIGPYIVHNFDLVFDGGDKANGSLYLCFEPGASSVTIAGVVDRLRGVGLWSQQQYKLVAAEQKSAYATQLQFVACAQFQLNGDSVLLARYTHLKFPSSAERWAEWLKSFDRVVPPISTAMKAMYANWQWY